MDLNDAAGKAIARLPGAGDETLIDSLVAILARAEHLPGPARLAGLSEREPLGLIEEAGRL